MQRVHFELLENGSWICATLDTAVAYRPRRHGQHKTRNLKRQTVRQRSGLEHALASALPCFHLTFALRMGWPGACSRSCFVTRSVSLLLRYRECFRFCCVTRSVYYYCIIAVASVLTVTKFLRQQKLRCSNILCEVTVFRPVFNLESNNNNKIKNLKQSWLPAFWKKKSKTHKRLKERFLIRRNRTKRANFRGNSLFQATYNTTENS